jgi:hypothetical protein
MPLCVDCGQDLAAEPEDPVSFVPRIEVANPLRERRARPPRRPPAVLTSGCEHVGRLRQLPWQAFRGGALGVVKGSIPGLMPGLRREWRTAGIELGLFLAGVGLALALGGVPEGLARLAWLVVLGWSYAPASECQRCMNVPQPYRAITAFWMVLGPVVVLSVALPVLVRGTPDPLFHYGMGGSLLGSGSYHIDDDALDTLRPGELVLLDRGDVQARLDELEARLVAGGMVSPERRRQVGERVRYNLEEFEVFPVVIVAVQGQELGWEDGELTVAGQRSLAVPAHTYQREVLDDALLGSEVPPEHLAVWDWIPYPRADSLVVRVVPRAQVMGRITHQPEGSGDFVPVAWPPGDIVPEEYL